MLTPGDGNYYDSLMQQVCAIITLSPWPLTVDRLDLNVSARELPAAHYASYDEAAAAKTDTVFVRWELRQPEKSS
jgi:hypothetical protein